MITPPSGGPGPREGPRSGDTEGAPLPSRPPALVRFLLRLLLPPQEREFFLGDLEERPPRSWAREILGATALRLDRVRSGGRLRGSAHGDRLRNPTDDTPVRASALSAHSTRPPSRGDGIMSDLLQDLRYGLRTLLRTPGFTVVALLTMALGIGANTAMFSIVNGVVLRPLPYPEPDRIVRVWESFLTRGWETFSLSPLNYWDFREQNRTLESLAAYQSTVVNYTGGDRPESLPGLRVTEDYLEVLGGEPVLGRGIRSDDLERDAPGVVLLSHGFWQRAFDGRSDVVGTDLILDDRPHTVVGILPEGWEVPGGSRRDVLLPMVPSPNWYDNRSSHFLHAYGRLRPGVSVEQARADFVAVAAALAEEYPDSNEGWGATVRSLDEVVLGSTRPQLLIFMASVGLILLIACANLANMTLARGMVRSREMAIRTAVGAGRGRVVRQLLAESLLLATLGGAVGVLLAYLALGAFVTGWPTLLPRMQAIQIDGRVLLFSLALSLVAGLLSGLAPALSGAGPSVSDALRQGSRSIAGDRSRRWMRTVLVTAEVGMAVILLVGSGLLVRSFAALQSEDPGFDPQDRLLATIPLSPLHYGTDEARRGFVDALLPGVRAIPGVESAALSTLIPIAGDDELWGFWLEGRPPSESESGDALFYRVTPGYFEAMGIPLLAGRDIADDDRGAELSVVVVSESFAEQQFPGESPIGRRFRFGREEDNPYVEIVGVVGDVQHYQLGEASTPQIYVPFQQQPRGYVTVVMKCAVPPSSLAGAFRDVVAALDPDQPLEEVRPAETLIDGAVARPRFRTLLMGGFGLTALLLAVVGLYGVMAYSVSQRTREIGVRMALGATRGSVLALVLREGAPLVGTGLVLGVGGAIALSRILESMLFGVGARDLAVFTAVPLLLAAVAATAMLIPARRASRVDPVRTLGGE